MSAARMTPRARAYMTICALRHLLLGLMCVVRPGDFTSPSYDGVKAVLPVPPDAALITWGVAFVLVALVAVHAAVTGSEESARHALTGSVVVTAMWVGGFVWSILTGSLVGWSGVIVWTALAAKDLTMLRDPLRNPFEDLIRTDPAGTEG
ncbi:hypothetical protein CHO01_25100 [Cellulomonas hominis]|uniref:Uncharacterized protein n=2 Tax=Cellulomonas hominis TaxID=156981 RepID=A0A511FFM1_9CELL|nr:hypothetical protein [Cellulomonas hominis]NKY05544.1 hypothetical protein [Cellulomonas hominis]GEL47394.1 hypothetical protein CHO01_25100 [Cellulomonas hominis]